MCGCVHVWVHMVCVQVWVYMVWVYMVWVYMVWVYISVCMYVCVLTLPVHLPMVISYEVFKQLSLS